MNVKHTKVVADLPNGSKLFAEYNDVGGRRYWTDEIAGGAIVWDTSVIDLGTILAALTEECRRQQADSRDKRKYAFAAAERTPAKPKVKAPAKEKPPRGILGRPRGRPKVKDLALSADLAFAESQKSFRNASLLRTAAVTGFEAGFDGIIVADPPPPPSSYAAEMARELAELAEEDETPPPPLDDYSIWKPRMEIWVENKMWMDSWGPQPGREGCEVPEELLPRGRAGR